MFEAVALSAVLLLGVASLRGDIPPSALARGALLCLAFGPILAALRLRLAPRGWRRGVLEELIFAVLLAGISALLTYELAGALGVLGDLEAALGGRLPLIAMFVEPALLFFGLRAFGVRVWIFWDRLRKRRLLWGLTHAHLMVVIAVIVGMAAFFSFWSGASVPNGEPAPQGLVASIVSTLALWLFPVLWTSALLSVFAVALLLAPSLVVSYFVARRATVRLETLAQATRRLRTGDYAVRVPVQGEDEVAQLQGDFNAMAANLQRAAQDLAAERDRVAGLLEARRQLIASVSHELRTPVATIKAYLEASLRQPEGEMPEGLRRDLAVVEAETARLQDLIEDLFALSRAEVGQLTLECTPTDIGPLVRRAVETAAPIAWQSGKVSVVAQIAPDLPRGQVDASRLNQVLANLLRNGVRHTPPGGIVAVAARRAKGGEVLLEVRDTGDGIAATDLPHVFERFYRGERQPANGEGGAGLGLALVKELVEAMGGTVAVASTPGQGSIFTIQIPNAG